MNINKPENGRLARFLFPKGSFSFGWVVIILLAFILGAFMFGGGDSSNSDTALSQDHSAAADSAPTIWTCSMHPNIRLPHPGKCPICFMDLIPLETGAGDSLSPNRIRLSEAARQLARIETSPVIRASAERTIRLAGKIAYDETAVAAITARISGRLDRLYVDYEGFSVKQGDRLAEIYSPELVAAQEELIQASRAEETLSKSTSPLLRSTARTTLDAARMKLGLFGLTEAQIKDIQNSGKVSDYITLNAPFGGTVINKNVNEGAYVTTGSKIYTIADLSSLWVISEAYESDLPWLSVGQNLSFDTPAFPGETFRAVIDFIDPLIDPRTRTAKVRAVVPNKNMRLKPGMFVRAEISSRLNDRPEYVVDQLLIPTTAPLITGTRAIVYVEIPGDDGPLFEARRVELGPRAGDYYVVKSGLSEGETVVTNGAFKIDSELQIRGGQSMMSAAEK